MSATAAGYRRGGVGGRQQPTSSRQSGRAVHVRRAGAGVRAKLFLDSLHCHVLVQSNLKQLDLQVRMSHMKEDLQRGEGTNVVSTFAPAQDGAIRRSAASSAPHRGIAAILRARLPIQVILQSLQFGAHGDVLCGARAVEALSITATPSTQQNRVLRQTPLVGT